MKSDVTKGCHLDSFSVTTWPHLEHQRILTSRFVSILANSACLPLFCTSTTFSSKAAHLPDDHLCHYRDVLFKSHLYNDTGEKEKK